MISLIKYRSSNKIYQTEHYTRPHTNSPAPQQSPDPTTSALHAPTNTHSRFALQFIYLHDNTSFYLIYIVQYAKPSVGVKGTSV